MKTFFQIGFLVVIYFIVVVLSAVFITGNRSIPQSLQNEIVRWVEIRSEIDRWVATEYTITCIEEWNSGHGIRTHSTHSQAPYCELTNADGVRYPLEYTINYACNGEDNLVFTLNENSWGRVFPGCENSTQTSTFATPD